MAKAQNKVIAGKFKNWFVWGGSYLCISDKKNIFTSTDYKINKSTVETYELITEETMKSGTSAILRGAAGVALLGPVGMLAGLTAKNKGIYTIAIQWKENSPGKGERSLIEIDDNLYKAFVKSMF